MKKKILMLILSAAMVITMMPSIAFAEEPGTISWENGKIAQLTKDSEVVGQYATIKEAVDEFNKVTKDLNANPVAGEYVITIKNGTYTESDIIVFEAIANKVSLLIEAETVNKDSPKVTIGLNSDSVTNKVFLVSGQSYANKDASFTVRGIKFDISEWNSSSDSKESAVIHCANGGSGLEPTVWPDAKGAGAHRYSHNITVDKCVVLGDKQATSKVFNSASNSQPSGLVVTDCHLTDLGYVSASYGNNNAEAECYFFTMKDTLIDGHSKTVLTTDNSPATVTIENCDITTYNDYTVRVRADSNAEVNIKNTSFKTTYSGTDAGAGTIVIRKGSLATVNVDNKTTFPQETETFHHINTNGGVTFTVVDGYKSKTYTSQPYYDFKIPTPVAKIGDVKYTTLQAAVDAAEAGDTVELIDNVVLEEELNVPVGKDFTLDLNGKKISNVETGFDFTRTKTAIRAGIPQRFNIIVEGDMTICDSSLAQTGKIEFNQYNYGTTKAILVLDNGSVTVDSGEVYGEYAAFYVIGDTSMAQTNPNLYPQLIVNGGKVSGKSYAATVKGAIGDITVNGGIVQAEENDAICTNGTTDWYDGGHCAINIYGGKVVSSNGAAIYNPAEATLTISGGEVIGATGVAIKGGKNYITGNAVIKGTGDVEPAGAAQSGHKDTGDALYVEDTYDNHTPVVVIHGGLLSSENGHAAQYYTNKTSDKGSLTISAGLFSDKPADEVVANGCAAVEIDNNVYHYIVGKGAVSSNKKITAGKYYTNPIAYVATGYSVKASGDKDYPYEVYQTVNPQKEVVTEQYTEVEISKEVPAKEVEAAATVLVKTDVTGVADALTQSGQNTIIREAEKTNTQLPAAIVTAKQIDIDITVEAVAMEVKTTATVTQATEQVITFELTPYAVVTAISNNGSTVSSEKVLVENDYLSKNKNEPIKVVLGTTFEPEQVLHVHENGQIEAYTEALVASYDNRTYEYDQEAGTVTLYVLDFSEVKILASAVPEYNVTFAANGGKGTMEPQKVVEGGVFYLPENGFTAPEGKVFDGWMYDGTKLQPGDAIEGINSDVTVTACWKATIITGDTSGSIMLYLGVAALALLGIAVMLLKKRSTNK